MKTSFAGLVFAQRLLITGGLSLSTMLSLASAQAQNPRTSQVPEARTVPSPGNQHSEDERDFYGQLFPLYDLLNAGSRRTNDGTPASFDKNQVSPAANPTVSRASESTSPAPYGPTTSPDSGLIPEVEEVVDPIALDAQPLALVIAGQPGSESPGAEASDSRKAYMLIFDPEDPRSQLAYQLAQAIAQTNELLDDELQASQPESEQAAEVLQNPPPIERVKVTGRLLQNAGLEAIAVTQVERTESLEPLAPLLEERQNEALTKPPGPPER